MFTKILCLHQSSELYGSDRSFLSAIESISNTKNQVHSILPFHGELVPLLRNTGSTVDFYPYGILRKKKLKKPFAYAYEVFKALFYFLKKFRSYDVIYINTTVMFSALMASGIYRLSGKKIYCHIREIPDGRSLLIFKFLLMFSGAKLIFNSQATQSSFRLPGKVVYNGVDELYPASTNHKDTRVKNILLIGRINTWKGQGLFIDALERLIKNTTCHFNARIVGSPFEGYEYLEKELMAKVDRYQLADNVQFISFCSDPSEHFKWADYVIVPSTKPEPFGRVAIEAFSVGKPVIAAGHGGLVEIVTDKHDGFIFEPSNIESLYNTLMSLPEVVSDEYSQMSSNAKLTYFKKFSIQSYKQHIISALNIK